MLADPSPGAAQATTGWEMGVSGGATLFLGTHSDFLDGGFGFEGTLSRELASGFHLRADAIVSLLDDQQGESDVAGNRIAIFTLGPEARVSLGRLEVYARGLVGLVTNRQTRSGSTADEVGTWATVLGGGAGARISLVPSLALDLGGDLIKAGELDFARTTASGVTATEDPLLLSVRGGIRIRLP